MYQYVCNKIYTHLIKKPYALYLKLQNIYS